jgi:hypothetical protein
MELNKIGLIGVILVAVASSSLAKPVVVNDGRKVTGLAQIENKLNDVNGTIELRSAMRNNRWPLGYLEMIQSKKTPIPPLRAAWYSKDIMPKAGEYKLWAEFQPSTIEGMGGVIGWLNNETGVGIYYQLNSYDGFQVGTVSFLTDDASTNITLDGLFNLDGSPAKDDYGSAWSDIGKYDPERFAVLQLTFSPPTDEDKEVLEDVTARISAYPSNARTTAKLIEGTTKIELLTNLPLPEAGKHRIGYFGFWDSIWNEGSKIGNFKWLRFEGEAYNELPTIEPIPDIVSNRDGTVDRIELLVADLETKKSQLKISASALDTDLIPEEGLKILKKGGNQYLEILPNRNKVGETEITVVVSDGTDQISTSFKLILQETVKADPPVLSISRNDDGGLIISWDGEGEIQYSSYLREWQAVGDVNDPFLGVPSNGKLKVGKDAQDRKFFRVVVP